MLTAKKVEREKKAGRYHDGHGLYLQIKNANNKSWLLRFERGGQIIALERVVLPLHFVAPMEVIAARLNHHIDEQPRQ